MHVHTQALHLCTLHLYEVFVYTCVYFIVLHGGIYDVLRNLYFLITCYKLSMNVFTIVHFYFSLGDPFLSFHKITLKQLLDFGVCFRNVLIL